MTSRVATAGTTRASKRGSTVLNLKQLSKDLTAKVAEIEAAEKCLIEAQAAKDEDKLTAAKESYDALEKEFTELEANVKKAEAHQARIEMREKIKGMVAPESPAAKQAVTSGVPTVPASSINYAENAQIHHDAFFKWMNKEHVSSKEIDLLTPKCKQFLDRKSEDGKQEDEEPVVLPLAMRCKIMGPKYTEVFGAKVIRSLNDAVLNPSLAHNLVPQEFRAQLFSLPTSEPTIMNRVTIIPSVTGTVTIPRLVQTDDAPEAGVSMTWVDEAATKPVTEPTFGQQEIAAHELVGYTEISDRMLSRSAIALEPLLTQLYRDAINREVDRVIFSGSGTGQPLGIIGASGVRTVARDGAGAVVYDDLVNVKHLVLPEHRPGALWFIADSVEHDLEHRKDTTNRPLFSGNVATGPYDRLVGYPYHVAGNSPELGSDGDVLFGNPKHYYLVVEEEIVVAKSKHFKFQSNRTAFKVYMVVGGRPAGPRAFAYLTGAGS